MGCIAGWGFEKLARCPGGEGRSHAAFLRGAPAVLQDCTPGCLHLRADARGPPRGGNGGKCLPAILPATSLHRSTAGVQLSYGLTESRCYRLNLAHETLPLSKTTLTENVGAHSDPANILKHHGIHISNQNQFDIFGLTTATRPCSPAGGPGRHRYLDTPTVCCIK